MATDVEAAWVDPHDAKPKGWHVGLLSGLLLSTMLIALMTACASALPAATGSLPALGSPVGSPETSRAASVDPLTEQLLRRYELVPRGPTTTRSDRIGEVDELPWALYIGASRQIGLGNGWRRGTEVELRQTPLASVAGIDGGGVTVMVMDGRLAGAWMYEEVTVPGLYALSAGP